LAFYYLAARRTEAPVLRAAGDENFCGFSADSA
jgi:hypothetical protein